MTIKREEDLRKAQDAGMRYDDKVRRLRAQLDRTHMSSAARKPLEKALQKLIREPPPLFDESREDEDDNP